MNIQPAKDVDKCHKKQNPPDSLFTELQHNSIMPIQIDLILIKMNFLRSSERWSWWNPLGNREYSRCMLQDVSNGSVHIRQKTRNRLFYTHFLVDTCDWERMHWNCTTVAVAGFKLSIRYLTARNFSHFLFFTTQNIQEWPVQVKTTLNGFGFN